MFFQTKRQKQINKLKHNLPGDALVAKELLCEPGDMALLGDAPPVKLSCTRRGISSADLAMLLPRPRDDLVLPGDPFEDFGTGRLDWPNRGVDFFIMVALYHNGQSENILYMQI